MKRSIKLKILFSFFSVMFISLLFLTIIFNVSSKKYMENKVEKNLKSITSEIKKLIKDDINTFEKESGSESPNKLLQSINELLKKTSFLQKVHYGIVSKEMKILYPKNKNSQEYKIIETDVLPILQNTTHKEKTAYSIVDSEKYIISLETLSLKYSEIPKISGWIVVYSSMDEMYEFGRTFSQILIITCIFTALVAIVVGLIIARSIAKPIILLKQRAELLSNRDFDTKISVKTGDELEELANTFNKVAKALKEYDSGQKKFLQNASHELKTPLMSISGYAEGIKDGVFDDNNHALDVIIEETSRLRKIVEELIFLSKLETMEDYYNFEIVDINDIIEKSIDKVRSLAIKKNVEISSELKSNLKVKIDKDKFTQALINILGNSIRYAKSYVNLELLDDENYLIITIKDDGTGFSDDEKDKIFERFYKGQDGSTGLGLAITKVIIEKHKGIIEARNNSGAEFIIKLAIETAT